MPTIQKEYPEYKASIEMELVRMLQEKRAWVDVVDIAKALKNVRRHAKDMQDEQELLHKKQDGGLNKCG